MPRAKEILPRVIGS